MNNPIDIIKRDHRRVEKLFQEFEELGDRAYESKVKVVEKIIHELKLHAEMEEALLYPRAEEIFNKEDDKMVEEAIAEHDVAKRILEELTVTHPEDPQFDARVKVLNENITHHIMEEEQELLPKVEEKMSADELDAIGEKMQAFRLEREGKESV